MDSYELDNIFNNLKSDFNFANDAYLVRVPEGATIPATSSRPKHNAVVMVDSLGTLGVLEILSAGYSHVVQQQTPNVRSELLRCLKMISATNVDLSKSKDANAILQPHFPSFTESTIFEFNASNQKSDALKQLNDFLNEENKLMALKPILLQSADGLLMNAMFSAPTHPTTKYKLFEKFKRDQVVSYFEGHRGFLVGAYNKGQVAVACLDPFGSLRREQLLKSFTKLLTGDSTAVRDGDAGAGIGLKYIVDNCTSFSIIMRANTYTSIGCICDLSGIKANFKAPKNISVVDVPV